MKYLISCMSMLLLVLPANAYSDAPETLNGEILAPVSSVFVPVGFDDNDVSEVVVQGVFPNSCYRLYRNGVTVDEKTKTIDVWVTAFAGEGENCAEIRSNYISTVKLGMLGEGEYTVRTSGFDGETPTLEVAASSIESPDELPYAPVEGAEIRLDAHGRQYLKLMGRFPVTKRGCLVMDEVIQRDIENNVLVVLPVMKTVFDDDCIGAQSSFNMDIGLAEPVIGPSLLHVRSINGDSYNHFVDL